ncbi:hypothetical protein GCM10025777_55830 [Membranihabitans marinus]
MPGNVVADVISTMTDIMVHDITNPPLAARFFAYACLAGYEVMSFKDSSYASMHEVLNQYPVVKHPISKSEEVELTAVLAMMATAEKIMPSGYILDSLRQNLFEECASNGYTSAMIEDSKVYADEISRQILKYIKEDGYDKMSQYPRYSPTEGEGNWYPTPPGYFPPVEPYFSTIRPFILNAGDQFPAQDMIPFSSDEDSPFMQAVMEVYNVERSEEEKEIAAFWDCNPFALKESGHLMIGLKKISPGAHWMGIANIACAKQELDFKETMYVNTVLAVTMMDGFLACWESKYRTDRIRPETVIRKYLDPQWKPFLQTPPFPEYTSGHSVVSTACGHILTQLFGSNFAFDDTVELRFGLPVRSFSSFKQAAEEAAISRLYGGIHYMDAIVDGQAQGLKVGQYAVEKLNIEINKYGD